jgi:hypothetical protein
MVIACWAPAAEDAASLQNSDEAGVKRAPDAGQQTQAGRILR